jgi:cobalt-zinc-cadmium resistance protein CzcA
VPSTSLEQSQAMQFEVEKVLKAQPEVERSSPAPARPRWRPTPCRPAISDTFVILKDRKDWPNPSLSKAELVERMEGDLGTLIGNAYEFTQPIQMRFNELIAGVRSDVAVKVYGDDFAAMSRRPIRSPPSLRGIDGAADVKVEQISGQPTITASVDRTAAAAQGSTPATRPTPWPSVWAGREAGHILEGDRRFDVVVRLDDELARRSGGHGPAAGGARETGGARRPCRCPASPASTPPKAPTRSAARTASGGSWSRPMCGAATWAVSSPRRKPPWRGTSSRRPAWLEWGGQFENLERASARLAAHRAGRVPGHRRAAVLRPGLGGRRRRWSSPACLWPWSAGRWLCCCGGCRFSISAAVGFIAVSGVATLNGLVLMQSIKQRMAGRERHRRRRHRRARSVACGRC